MFLVLVEAQNWMQFSSCHLLSGEQRKRVTSLNWVDPAAQDTVSYLCYTSAWLAYDQLVVCQDLEVLLCRSAFQLAGPLCVLIPQLFLPKYRTLHFRDSPAGSVLQPEYLWMAAQVPGASDIPTGLGLKNTVY